MSQQRRWNFVKSADSWKSLKKDNSIIWLFVHLYHSLSEMSGVSLVTSVLLFQGTVSFYVIPPKLIADVMKKSDKYSSNYTSAFIHSAMKKIFTRPFPCSFPSKPIQIMGKYRYKWWWICLRQNTDIVTCLQHIVSLSLEFTGLMSHSRRRYTCVLPPIGLTTPPKRIRGNYKNYPSWTLKFNLDKHLALNLTFLYIYISSTSINKCNYGRYEVQMVSSRTLNTIHCFSPNQDTFTQVQPPVIFCGIHPQKTVLSSSHITYFAAYMRPYVLNTTTIAYSILDKAQIETVSNPKNLSIQHNDSKNVLQYEQGIVSQTKMQLNIFRLNVLKKCRVVVRAPSVFEDHLEFFDGPGSKSPKIKARHLFQNSIHFIMSTFQCIFFFYLNKFPDFGSLAFSFLSESSPIVCKTLYVSSNETQFFSFFTNDSNFGVCLKFYTEREQRINFTATEINYNGTINTEDCRFSGIAALSDQEEMLTLCHYGKYSNEFFFNKTYNHLYHPSIYSPQNKLTIIFYTYIEYGSLTAVSCSSTTSCNIRIINACKSGELQVRKHFFLRIGNVIVGNIAIKLTPGKCSIIQVQYNFDNRKEHSDYVKPNTLGCETSIRPLCSHKQEYHESLSIKAYLRGL